MKSCSIPFKKCVYASLKTPVQTSTPKCVLGTLELFEELWGVLLELLLGDPLVATLDTRACFSCGFQCFLVAWLGELLKFWVMHVFVCEMSTVTAPVPGHFVRSEYTQLGEAFGMVFGTWDTQNKCQFIFVIVMAAVVRSSE